MSSALKWSLHALRSESLLLAKFSFARQRVAPPQSLGPAGVAGDVSAVSTEFFAKIVDLERSKKELEQRLVRAHCAGSTRRPPLHGCWQAKLSCLASRLLF